MSWKQTAQYSFADALLVEHKALSKLDDVHEIIDWKQIEKTLSHLYASKRGVPAYPPLMMFKSNCPGTLRNNSLGIILLE